jgi:HSP20 family molecular chaperone IbpA
MTETRDLQAREKQVVATPSEQTRPGLVFTPAVDIFETDAAITLLADIPGVVPEDVQIDLRDNVLTINATPRPWENAEESDVLIEFEIGNYYRQFTLADVIDQAKIEAKIQDGVLRLVMPKAAKALPRKITVNEG